MKFGAGMGHEIGPLNFGVDSDEETDPGILI